MSTPRTPERAFGYSQGVSGEIRRAKGGVAPGARRGRAASRSRGKARENRNVSITGTTPRVPAARGRARRRRRGCRRGCRCPSRPCGACSPRCAPRARARSRSASRGERTEGRGGSARVILKSGRTERCRQAIRRRVAEKSRRSTCKDCRAARRAAAGALQPPVHPKLEILVECEDVEDPGEEDETRNVNQTRHAIAVPASRPLPYSPSRPPFSPPPHRSAPDP